MSVINGYNWAQNRSKLERAISEVKNSGQVVTEDKVLAVYRRLLGVVIESNILTKKEIEQEAKEEEKKIKIEEKNAEIAAKKDEKEAKKK